MKIPSMSPWTIAAIGVSVSLIDLLIKGKFDLYVLGFWLIAATVEVFSRKQKRVPSLVLTFVVALAIVFFIRTNVIMLKTISNSSAEPYIEKGARVFYQPNFYSIKDNDLVVIKKYDEARSLICRVLGVGEQSYKLEIISRRQIIETPIDNIEGKIVYVLKAGSESTHN